MELLADRAGAAWRRALACRSVSPEHLNGDAAHFQPGRIFRSSLVVHLLVLSGWLFRIATGFLYPKHAMIHDEPVALDTHYVAPLIASLIAVGLLGVRIALHQHLDPQRAQAIFAVLWCAVVLLMLVCECVPRPQAGRVDRSALDWHRLGRRCAPTSTATRRANSTITPARGRSSFTLMCVLALFATGVMADRPPPPRRRPLRAPSRRRDRLVERLATIEERLVAMCAVLGGMSGAHASHHARPAAGGGEPARAERTASATSC